MNEKDVELKFGYNKLFFVVRFIFFSLLGFISERIINFYEISGENFIHYSLATVLVLSLTISITNLIRIFQGAFLGLSSEYFVNLYPVRFTNNSRTERKFQWSEIEKFEKVDTLFLSKQIHIILKDNIYDRYDYSCQIRVPNSSEFTRDEIYDVLNEKLNLHSRGKGRGSN